MEFDIVDEMKANHERKQLFSMKKLLNLNPKQMDFLNLIREPKTNMIFVDGPAGTAKTYAAVYGAMEALKSGRFEEIIYIRSIIESASKSIGALPGEIDEKFSPYAMPLVDKLNEIIEPGQQAALFDKKIIRPIPFNFLRGLTFNKSIVIIDETQNAISSEIVTALTRFGRDSMYIVLGDTKQADIGKSSGFSQIVSAFCNPTSELHHIHCVKFDESDICRSKILRYIVKALEHVK